jgi:hypothetical protein
LESHARRLLIYYQNACCSLLKYLVQLLCVVYGLNYLDKTTLSYASVLGITLPKEEGGIGLVGHQYNWLGSMFYFGYLAWEYPTSRCVRKPLDYVPLLSFYQAVTVSSAGEVLRLQHHNVGHCSRMFRSSRQLLWRRSSPLLPWPLRSCSHARLRLVHIAMGMFFFYRPRFRPC